jgi:hypothetical protein
VDAGAITMPGNDVASDNGEEGASFAIDGNDVNDVGDGAWCAWWWRWLDVKTHVISPPPHTPNVNISEMRHDFPILTSPRRTARLKEERGLMRVLGCF